MASVLALLLLVTIALDPLIALFDSGDEIGFVTGPEVLAGAVFFAEPREEE
jgi:hypothetical protein